jgi:hypothetical protein
MLVRVLQLCAWCVVFLAPLSVNAAEPPAVELTIGGAKLLGRPLVWSKSQVCLLAPSGRVWDLDPRGITDVSQTSTPFRGLTKNELRAELQREFGNAFEVTSTGNYLVVHPAGESKEWAERFEMLYRSFVHYFRARGFQPQSPMFPMVAIVFPRQEDFQRYAISEGESLPRGVLGYYSPLSNRVALFDSTAGKSGDWTLNAETIIHEAAHQTAFNTGVHSRWAMPPRWVAEGLGTMFEARGVYDAPHYTNQKDRLNQGRLTAFRRYAAGGRKQGALAELIASDRPFQRDPDGAYAEAWALTFYLTETEPRKYFAYLARTGSHPPFAEVSGPQRLKDFTSVFGEQLDLLEAKMVRYMGAL